MRQLYLAILLPAIALLTGCAVHQWPEKEEQPVPAGDVTCVLRLRFHPEVTRWEHLYDVDTQQLTPIGQEEPVVYDNTQPEGIIRYIVRVYAQAASRVELDHHVGEYLFTRRLSEEGYDFETQLTLPEGAYTLAVWSDIWESDAQLPRYDATDFAQVELTDHAVNTDYRDAFRGMQDLTLTWEGSDAAPVEAEVAMHRPMAKFEIVAEGLEDFLEQEQLRAARSGLDEYQVVLAYTGYTPFAYNVLTDALVDSRYGEQFLSGFRALDETSASLGFDYVLVRPEESSTRVQVGVFRKSGEPIALSEPLVVPLRRDHHTVIRGKFLSAHASGGFVGVDPGYDGDFNIFQ